MLPNQLSDFGLTIKSVQHLKLLIESMDNRDFDLLLIAEDIPPKKAMYIAQEVRATESTHRILIVYLCHANERGDHFDGDLKAAGIDGHIEVTTRAEEVAVKLSQWLVV